MQEVPIQKHERAELSEVERISRLGRTPSLSTHLGANLGVPNTGADLGPVALVGDAVLQPAAGVVFEVVLEVDPVEDGAAGALGGDGVGEDDEAEEDADDEEHGPEVDVHEKGVAVASAGESGEGDDHDGGSDDDDRPLEELQAVGGVGSAAQPYSATEDGDGEQEVTRGASRMEA
ncbi:hypothetical protein U1Q18_033154 [Sarracenia purpurea var. burkii]